MTKTTILTALRFALSLATIGPAHAGHVVAYDASPPNTIVLVRKAHLHVSRMERAITEYSSAHVPDREEDPFASMHFE